MKKFKEYFRGMADPQTGQQWVDRFMTDRRSNFHTVVPDPDGKMFDQIISALQRLKVFEAHRRQNMFTCVYDHQYIVVEHRPEKQQTVIIP